MPSLQSPVHHFPFPKRDLWRQGESGGKALYPRLWTSHLSECGSYREETYLSPLSGVDLAFLCCCRLQLSVPPVPKSRDFTDALGPGPN